MSYVNVSNGVNIKYLNVHVVKTKYRYNYTITYNVVAVNTQMQQNVCECLATITCMHTQ